MSRLRSLLRGYRSGYETARASLFWALLRRQKRTLRWMFVAIMFQTVGFLEITNFTRSMVDNGIVDQTAPLWPYVTHILFWAVWVAIFTFALLSTTARLSYQLEFDMRTWLYTHVQAAELRRLQTVDSGQLVTRALTDLQLLENLLTIFPTVIGYTPLLLAISVYLFVVNPIMGVISLLALPINLWYINRFRTRLRALSWADLNERAEVTAAIDEPVRGIRVVKAFGRELEERDRVRSVTGRAFRFAMNRARVLAHYDGFVKSIPLVIQAGQLAAGAYLLSRGELSLGTFLIAFQLTVGFNQFASAFGVLADAWLYLRGAQDRLAEMLALSARPVTDGRMLPEPSTGLEVRDVAVRFGERSVLNGLTLTVGPGDLVVVTGSPGTGKSTLAGIASGMLDLDEGCVSLDGIDLQELDPVDLRRVVRVVSEEPLLFAASLRDNLLMGAWGEVDDDALGEALRIAGADEVLDHLHGGLDGAVGDRGLTLSGGQRQRVALARALVARPRVLILDDALSAVNPSLELEIVRRVRHTLPDTAILFITRRPGVGVVATTTRTLEAPVTVPRPSTDMEATDSEGADVDDVLMGTTFSGALEGLAAVDPKLAKLVHELELSDDTVDVPDEAETDDEPPTFRNASRHFRRLMLLTCGVALLAAAGELSPSLMFGRITNIIQTSGTGAASNQTAAYWWALALVGVAVVLGFVNYAFRITANRYTQSVVCLLRRRVFHRLCRLGIDYYDREQPGQVAARVVADLDKILQFLTRSAFVLLSYVAIFVVSMAWIVVLAPSVLPVVLALVGAIVVITLIELPIVNRAFNWARDELGTVTAKFEEDFVARHEIRNIGAAAIQTQKFVEASWNRRRARWWSALVFNAYTAVLGFIGNMTAALVLYTAGNAVLALELSIGAALTVQLLATAATQPFQLVGPLYSTSLDARISWQRLREPFLEPVLPVEKVAAVACPALNGDVRFQDITFRYPQVDRLVLRGVSFGLAPSRVTALVGYTGAGKSSIAKLLTRMYDPDAGAITVGGVDLRDVTLASLRDRLSVVPQDAFVFKGTIASNLRYGRPSASDEELERALHNVGAADLLTGLRDGLQHRVDEEGRNLTAAERQLIALARAWLTGPDVLVLDEATSLLDSATEAVVIESLGRLECTTLMITHRENVAASADWVVVLDAGRVVDEGREEHVARAGGPYDRLWRVQEDELAEQRDRDLSVTGPGFVDTGR